MASSKSRIAVIFNRDFEGADADPENRAREDIKDIASHLVGVLDRRGHQTFALGVTGDVAATMIALRGVAPHIVFNLCESIHGDNRFEPLLPMLMDLEGIAYTGSGPLALALALHKHKAKEILCARGVFTPKAILVRRTLEAKSVPLDFPLIVKPAQEDASVGICSESVVHDRKSLEERVRIVLHRYRQPALVEQYIEGREIYVSMLAHPSGGPPEVFPFFEIDFSDMPSGRPNIVSFEGKWVEDSVEYRGTRPVLCEGLVEVERVRIAAAALGAFEALDLRDYARVDIRFSTDGTPYVIDVNPNCDLSDLAGGFPRAAKAGGLSYDDLIARLVQLAVSRRQDADTIPLAKRPGISRRDDRIHPEPFSGGGSVVRARAPRGGA